MNENGREKRELPVRQKGSTNFTRNQRLERRGKARER